MQSIKQSKRKDLKGQQMTHKAKERKRARAAAKAAGDKLLYSKIKNNNYFFFKAYGG